MNKRVSIFFTIHLNCEYRKKGSVVCVVRIDIIKLHTDGVAKYHQINIHLGDELLVTCSAYKHAERERGYCRICKTFMTLLF